VGTVLVLGVGTVLVLRPEVGALVAPGFAFFAVTPSLMSSWLTAILRNNRFVVVQVIRFD
jgi:hypothetical protein